MKAARLREDLDEYRNRYEEIQRRREADRDHITQFSNMIADAQNELEMLRARWKQLTDEEKRLIADNARYWEELQKARNVSGRPARPLTRARLSRTWTRRRWAASTSRTRCRR